MTWNKRLKIGTDDAEPISWLVWVDSILACLPSKIIVVWIYRFCVRCDWWRHQCSQCDVYHFQPINNRGSAPYHCASASKLGFSSVKHLKPTHSSPDIRMNTPSQHAIKYIYIYDKFTSPPIAVSMRQWIGSALVQIMACCPFGGNPLSKLIQINFQFDP